MDNNNWEAMQNWKKQIIMDYSLNSLFDVTLSPQQFFRSKIVKIMDEQQQIMSIYTKLGSLKHSISKSIQKEVQTKYQLIEDSFSSLNHLNLAFPKPNGEFLISTFKYLQKFNSKYQHVESSLLKWKNITKLLRYAQALESFYVYLRLLKTLLKNYDNTYNIDFKNNTINILKATKILKQLTSLTQNHDFNGVEFYQRERIFLKNTKDNLYIYIDKQLTQILANYNNYPKIQSEIKQKITCLACLNRLSQFSVNYFKTNLKQFGQVLKKVFNSTTIQQFSQMCSLLLLPKIKSFAITIVQLEENLKKLKIQNMSLFAKIWDNFIPYIKDITRWKFDQQNKEKSKDIQKMLCFKYPAFFECLQSIVSQIHSYLITHTHYNYYQFISKKQQIMLTIFDLSKTFYKAVDERWKILVMNDVQSQNSSQKVGEIIKVSGKNKLYQFLTWVVSNIKNREILTNIIQNSKIHMSKIRQKCSKLHLIQQFNAFNSGLKNILISNNYLQLDNISTISQFKLLFEENAVYRQQHDNVQQ